MELREKTALKGEALFRSLSKSLARGESESERPRTSENQAMFFPVILTSPLSERLEQATTIWTPRAG